MTGLLVRVAVAPLLGAPSLGAEQVSQLVLGEGAEVLERQGAMLRVRTLLDQYEGWIHVGYVHLLSLPDAVTWVANAAWSEGALLEGPDGVALRAPHRARLPLDGDDHVRLPAGQRAAILSGAIRPWGDVMLGAQQEPPADWAWREFAGSPYLWGGVSAAGIDCSGLVQTTFLARGVPLPRDARQQVSHGQHVELGERRAGDLLFFHGEGTDRITHVAILAGHETIVHSTIETGQVTRESFAEGTRAAPLLGRLVAVRRLT
jgi:gamma-D-glutamyl-L-lysine dipeptidyl-peptidase